MDSPAAQMTWQEVPDARQHLPRHPRARTSRPASPAATKSQQIRHFATLARKLRRWLRRHEDRQMNPLWDAVMETPTYIALSRQMALQAQMDVVANNIANANTQGFKA